MADTKHDREAKQLAKKLGAEYNPGKGVDIITPEVVIEYEAELEGLGDGIRQLQGYKKRRYLGVSPRLVEKAIARTKKTKVGVITPNGTIRKPAGRPKRGKKR